MQPNDSVESAASLVAQLRHHVEQLEAVYDRLAEFGAFSLEEMRGRTAEPWRREAIELRSRLSVLI